MKKIVTPGELVTAERKNLGEHVFARNGKIYSDVLGLVLEKQNLVSVVPLEGSYTPKVMDLIVGIVESERATGFMVDVNSFAKNFLSKKETRESLHAGSVISAKVKSVNELKEAELSDIRVFYGGEVISINAVKVPRVIGRNGSMLEVLKNGTNCSLLVGRNGWIWAKGGNISLLIKAVQKIEREAHLENLTNKIQDFLAFENKSVKVKSEGLKPGEAKMIEKLDKEVIKKLGKEGE